MWYKWFCSDKNFTKKKNNYKIKDWTEWTSLNLTLHCQHLNFTSILQFIFANSHKLAMIDNNIGTLPDQIQVQYTIKAHLASFLL